MPGDGVLHAGGGSVRRHPFSKKDVFAARCQAGLQSQEAGLQSREPPFQTLPQLGGSSPPPPYPPTHREGISLDVYRSPPLLPVAAPSRMFGGGGDGSPTHAPPRDRHVALMGYIDGACNTIVRGDPVRQEGNGGSPPPAPGVAGASEHHHGQRHVRSRKEP